VHLVGAASQGEALAGAIHDAFWVAAAVCAIGIVTSLVRGSGKRGRVEGQVAAVGPSGPGGPAVPGARPG